MTHTQIVSPLDLSHYADRRVSEGVIPELIYLLVRQSTTELTECRIPYGDSINQLGMDGIVKCNRGFSQYVPNGHSIWEIGTGINPQEKATKDFGKRTDEIKKEKRRDITFVFVTPRSSGQGHGRWIEPKQTKWIENRKEHGWKDIRIIDGDKLADWIREFPVLGRWMAKEIGLTSSLVGISTPKEHWSLLQSEVENAGDPPLPAELFTANRSAALNEVEHLFAEKKHRVFLFAESEDEVQDFVSAYLHTLGEQLGQELMNRCLFISDENAWHSFSCLHKPHVFVASPRLELEGRNKNLLSLATQNRHGVIVPLCGVWSGPSPEIIKLQSPSAYDIENTLKKHKFPEERARELGRIGDRNLSGLQRHYSGLGFLPPYATWKNADQLALANLFGQWDANNSADVTAMEGLLGKSYGEWIETLRTDALRSGTPLIQTNESWRIISRGEAWNALGSRITDGHIEHFREIAISVLGEQDPKFDLPQEDRFAATLYEKSLKHSRYLRKGIAETLALMGSRPNALSSCSQGKAEGTAAIVVRKLLQDTNWEQWASLDSLLILLAEAAPHEFLSAVELALRDLSTTVFHEILAQEQSGGLSGSNYMTGLLWALETLAWSPDFLSRVSTILAELDSIDPGGNWANRPGNSLTTIFLPSHVQTSADFLQRKSALMTILKEQPDSGWKTLISLFPHNFGFTSGTHKPTWREFIPRDWTGTITQGEYRMQIEELANLAVTFAKTDVKKLGEIVEYLTEFPEESRLALFSHLSSESVVCLPEPERFSLWEKLSSFIQKHRQHPNADWAYSGKQLTEIEAIVTKLSPKSPEFKYRHLFESQHLIDLGAQELSYDDEGERVYEIRKAAVLDFLNQKSLKSLLDFAENITRSSELGRILGNILPDEFEPQLLPSLLDSKKQSLNQLVKGYVWARYYHHKEPWLNEKLSSDWSLVQKSILLKALPFRQDTWQKVSNYLGEQNEYLYWEQVEVNPYISDSDLTLATKKLLLSKRPEKAILCIAKDVHEGRFSDENLACRALLSLFETPVSPKGLDTYRTIEVIKYLQNSPATESESLFKIEWNFLPLLDHHSKAAPIALERRLSEDPKFFAELLTAVFRSRDPEKRVQEEPNERQKFIAQNGYRLLHNWKRCPGIQDDGSFDDNKFDQWIAEVRRITKETGHEEVALSQIGDILTQAPGSPEADGLWIHEAVATVLNLKDVEEMRSGFTLGLRNKRGMYEVTYGKEERKIAERYRIKAGALDSKGYTRFAAAMRKLAADYDRDAERQEQRDPDDD